MAQLPAIFSVICILVVSASALLPVQQEDAADVRRDATDGRLPRDVVPTHYNLEIRPNIDLGSPPFPFDGYVEIFIRCLMPTTSVTLNFKDLSFVNDMNIINDPDSPISAPSPIFISYTADAATDFLTLNFVNPLVSGATYVVKINFYGVLRGPTERGIYYDYYVDRFGVTQYIVATQLESIFARAMFPCFDEPDLKATFGITIVRSPGHISLSNMNQIGTGDRPDGTQGDVYATSPIMSTYQVCVIVGEFWYVEAEWQNVTTYPVRIYSRPDMIPNLQFAATIAPLIQAWFEEYTGIPYTLPKMDHIALPSKSGAMENWGLITYSEYYLCANRQKSAVTGYMTVALVVAHELAHQWFGNLVTCKWWDDIWLNEGFAANFEYLALESIGWPTREIQQVDGSGTQQFLDVDAKNQSDSIIKNIATVWQAPGAFSGSTYPKGGAMLRQLRGFLPEITLQTGLSNYLRLHSNDSATTDNLWTSLTEQAAVDGLTFPDGSALDLKIAMDPWMNQMGFPLLTVTNSFDGTAQVTTERFFNPLGQSPDTPSAFNYEWNTPISVVTSATVGDWDDVMPSQWIRLGESSTTIDGIPTYPNEWSLINPKQMAFYRVNYDDSNRAAIVNQLLTDHTVIPSESKSQLIDDTFTLARLGYLNETSAMELTQYLGAEFASFNPWSATLKHVLYADRITRHYLWHSLYSSYIMNLVEPVYSQIGWTYNDSDSPLVHLLRRNVITTACFYGLQDCWDNARLYYSSYKMDPSSDDNVDSNNLPMVLCTGVSEGTSDDWSMVFDQYMQRKETPFREERYAYLFAMSCSSDTAYLDIYLNYIIGGSLINTRDQTQALRYMVQNNVGLPMVWAYLDNSWNTVPSTISKWSILQNIVTTFYTDADSASFNNFVGKYPPNTPNELNLYRQMDKVILQNIDWINNNEDSLSNWLVDHVPLTRNLHAPLPTSPLEYWYSMPVGLEEYE